MFSRVLPPDVVVADFILANAKDLKRIVLTARPGISKTYGGVKFVRRLQSERLTLFPPGNRELKGVFA
jgi:hypothetical protein